MTKRIASLLIALLIASWLPAGFLPADSASAASSFKDVPRTHWAYAAIEWAVEEGIVSGYSDGTFKPDRAVSEPEFLVMLARAYPELPLPDAEGKPWHAPYFELAASYQWPVWHETDAERYDRGRVAQLLAATQGQLLPVNEAVQLLLDRGMASGKTSATVEGFAASEALTRAEAITLVRNLLQRGITLLPAGKGAETKEEPAPEPVVKETIRVRGIAIDDSEASVLEKLGEPIRKDASKYGFQWYIYHDQYRNYAQIGVKNGKVVGLYTNGEDWSTPDGLTLGSTLQEVEKVHGQPLESIRKGSTIYMQNESLLDEARLYLTDGSYVTYLLDIHKDYTVTSVLVIKRSTEVSLRGFYGTPSEELRRSYERQIFDLANSTRVRFGLQPFDWDDKAAVSSRKHSKDMADNGFFDHINLHGLTPFDRMKNEGLQFRTAAENIAAGQTNAIYAHEAWMNSLDGHREAILSQDLTRLGVGVHMGGDMHVYYTQNFYRP